MPLNSNYKINSELVNLEPNTLLSLYELDISTVIREPYVDLSYAKYFFHGYHIRPEDSNGRNQEEKNGGVLIWRGDRYYYYPIEARDFELNGDGSLPRPSLIASNIFPYLKDLTLSLNDLVGATIKRKRVFRQFLDGEPDADINAGLPEDIYVIYKKKTENKSVMEFELVSIIEHNNIALPRRQSFRNYCSWKYRGEGCNYSKATVIDEKNNYHGTADASVGVVNANFKGKWKIGVEYKADDMVFHFVNEVKHYFLCKKDHTSSGVNKINKEYWVRDICAKNIAACKMRFQNRNLPFGAFPGTARS